VEKKTSSIEDPIIARALNDSSLHVNRRLPLVNGVNLLKSMAQQSHEEYNDKDEDEEKHDELSISDDSDDSNEISIENEKGNNRFEFASRESSSFDCPSSLSDSHYSAANEISENLISDLSSSVNAGTFDSPSESSSS
jgi:hypothetical protein